MTKKLLLALLCVIGFLPLSGAVAADAERLPAKVADSNPLDGNYVLTLVGCDNDKTALELSVVFSTTIFNTASAAEPSTNFAGSCTPQGNGSYLVSYSLIRVVQSHVSGFRNVTTVSTVQLHLGEPMQIIKDGSQTFTLKLELYSAAKH